MNAGNPLFTNMKLIPNAVPPKDMEYVNGLGVARERIYAAAGIPDTVWKVSDSNRGGATVGTRNGSRRPSCRASTSSLRC